MMHSHFRFVRIALALLAIAGATAARAQTTTTVNPAADAYVQDGSTADTNYGTGNGLYVKKNATAGANRWSYFKFPISGAGGTITGATFRLYGKNGGTGYSGTDTVSGVSDTTWSETGITWNNKPIPSSALSSATITSTAQYVQWDVTAFIKARQTAGATSVSLVVMMDALPATGQADNFNARENNNNKPQLVLTASTTPAVPQGLSATAANGKVTLAWNSANAATGYNLKRATTSGGPYTTIISQATTTYVDNTVTNGTTYYYVVSATNAVGESANSSEASATPNIATNAPTNLKATAGNTQVALTWTGVAGATSYNVKQATSNGGHYYPVATGVTTTAYTDGDVTNGQKYYYVVTAVNGGGESGNSNQAAATPTTTATATALADAYVRDGTYATANYGTVTSLYVKKNASAGANRWGYLRFPISAIAGNVQSVKLRLYGKHQGTAAYSGTETVYGVTDTAWTETGLTWNNKPILGSAISTSTVTETAQYVEWNVTAFVQAQKDAGATVASFALLGNSIPADGQSDQFNSREAASNQPQLVATSYPRVSLAVNFQPSTSAVPSGFVADTGAAFSVGSGSGWVREDSLGGTHLPLDLTPNTRDRARSGIAPELNTVIHMQYPTDMTAYPDPTSGPLPVRINGAWELAVPNGNYSVTVSVGDKKSGGTAGYDSQNTINVEGTNIINRFQATANQEYVQATTTVYVTDGRLTVDAIGGTNTKLDYAKITNIGVSQAHYPLITSVYVNKDTSGNGTAFRDTAVSADVYLPNIGAGVDQNTLSTSTVQLYRTSDNTAVPGLVTTDGAGGALVYQPSAQLAASTGYTFKVTSGLKDESGAAFVPYTFSFTTGTDTSIVQDPRVTFSKSVQYTISNDGATSLAIGADGKLYAAFATGALRRWAIDPTNGSLSNMEELDLPFLAGRTIIGLCFDPTNANVLWISDSDPLYPRPAEDFTGRVDKLTLYGPGFNANVQPYLMGLPRSAKDHLTNSLAFGPDGKLYLTQGANTAMGGEDPIWANRDERLLCAAVLQIDPTLTTGLPINVQTENYVKKDGTQTYGNYNPYASGAPVQLYADGLRNAYDLVWHSNGHLYCATNGSAAGGNTPASPAGVSPAVPAVVNGATEDDWLFNVAQGGYYGHANPTRGEYVMNGGNPTSGVDVAEVAPTGSGPGAHGGYPVGVQPDPNYRGFAYDIGRNRSPDGALEYKSATFSGALQHKMLVVEYSGGKDIIAFTFGSDGNIARQGNGNLVAPTLVQSGLSDPLDIVEDARNGDIYVAEFLGGGTSGQISLLRPVAPRAVATPSALYYNVAKGMGPTAPQTVTISNTGLADMSVSSITPSGTDVASFTITSMPALPVIIPAGSSVTVSATFSPTTTGIKSAQINITTSDPNNATLVVPLRGLSSTGQSGKNEASLQWILDTFQIPINVGSPDPSTSTMPGTSPLGDEVLIPRFQKAGPGNVTMQVIACFGAQDPASGLDQRFGWYTAGNPNSQVQLFTIANAYAQTLNPVVNGTTSFDPGTTRFGFYGQWPYWSNTYTYQEDYLNTFGTNTKHYVRVYVYKDKYGSIVPNTYLVASGDASPTPNYNDMVAIVSNVMPATGTLSMQNLDGIPYPDRFVFNRIQNPVSPINPPTDGTLTQEVHDTATLRLTNTGLDPVVVSSLPIVGPWTLPTSPTLPATIAAGGTLDVPMQFVATTGSPSLGALYTGSLTVQTNIPDQPSIPVTLAGFWQQDSEHGEEPPTATIVNGLYGYQTNIGFADRLPLNTGAQNTAVGDEVLSAYWTQADTTLPVSVQQLAAFHTYRPPLKKAALYWYKESDKPAIQASEAAAPATQSKLFKKIFAHSTYDSQSILPHLDGSTTLLANGTFSPGGVAFGFNVDYWASQYYAGEDSDRDLTDPTTNTGTASTTTTTPHAHDALNGDTEPMGHHMRFWPVVGRDGYLIPNTYIMSIDYNSINYDFQDNAYLISNIQPEQADLTAFVNPFVGSAQGTLVTGGTSSGATFPGATVPFGMVKLSPDTPISGQAFQGGGYNYSASMIQGFSHTHLSGTGGNPVYGDIPLMPTVGNVATSDPTQYASTFSHSQETATPGYYAVNLASYGITAELTASTHVGWHRYTFPATSQANVLFNVAGSFRGAANAGFTVVSSNTVEGFVTSYGYLNSSAQSNTNKPYTVYFTAQFSRPFVSYGTWNGGTMAPGQLTTTGSDAGGYVTFDATSTPSVVAKVGISFLSLQGARNNLAAETGTDFNFDGARQAAHDTWNTSLRKVATTGGTISQRNTFYTALYHSLLFPNVYSDYDGTYRGFDQQPHQALGSAQYSNFSLWDTYRTEHQLLDLVAPVQAHDMMASLMDVYNQAGWLPRWMMANTEGNNLIGDPVIPVLVDAYNKGILGSLNAENVYQAMLHNATQQPSSGSEFEGRLGLASYVSNGYVPYVPGSSGVNQKLLYGGATTLEYSLSDGALSLMATSLGHTSDAQMLTTRAHNYRSQWDSSTLFTHPHLSDGTFYNPFNPVQGTGFKEGTAWQYTWMTPQDVGGLITLIGGTTATASKLDTFFDYADLSTSPQTALTTQWGTGGHYNPYNEPNIHAPYLYAYVSQPWKTQTVVNAARTLYNATPSGIPGNDDLGEMSAWYVMSALGLYPVMPGADFYALTTPQFAKAVVTLDPAYYTASTLTVQAPTLSAANQYVQSLTVNGTALNQAWLRHGTIKSGANLIYTLGSAPSKTWATDPSLVPPTVCP